MADDLIAGGRPMYRDSAGVLRESLSPASDPSVGMLPASDFTAEQAAMARLPLPFRNMVRDPFVPAIIATGAKTTAYPAAFLAAMAAKGCSSFRIINPNTCYIRFRGAVAADDLITEGQGRLMAPGAVEVFSTQNPTFLSVMPVVRPGFPIPTELASPELNYGIGS